MMNTKIPRTDPKPIAAPASTSPRIILHGGAGNIRRENLPETSYQAYRSSLLSILAEAQALLSHPDATALDVAVHAVSCLENDPLFNCGKGAVFTRSGTTELEASVMVSNGYKKRGVGCMLLKHVKNPIKLAREMLVRGEAEDGGGAGGHSQLSGEVLEALAEKWGMDMVEQDYFFTQRRWDEHMKGLEREGGNEETSSSSVYVGDVADDGPSWDGREYLPQGTVGAVVLDRLGIICAATSTGGLTNKLPGRIGDTPTLGAGFWAEEWEWVVDRSNDISGPSMRYTPTLPATLDYVSRGDVSALFTSCLPGLFQRIDRHHTSVETESSIRDEKVVRHAVGMSGTGNGDSFLRTNAVRTTAAMARFTPHTSLTRAVRAVAGPGGELERSAGDRFGKTGEGEGGIIGIELVGSKSRVTWDYNCGGMFRAWVDDTGEHKFMVFRDK